MRLPDFLIIGAMKSGTTTLFRDLDQHPSIYFPDEKEPNDLTRDTVLSGSGKQKYASFFFDAGPTQICGEASTASTKLPTFPGVPRRARQLLGDDLRLIYVVRDPVSRTLSHHRFCYQRNEMPRDFGQALKTFPELIDYSRYAMQLTSWLEHFSLEQIQVMIFEEYVVDRPTHLSQLCDFLGVEDHDFETGEASNATKSALIPTGPVGRLVRSPLYRRTLKNWFSPELRRSLKQRVFRTNQRPDPIVREDLVMSIREELRQDSLEFANLTGKKPADWSTIDTTNIAE